VPAALNEAATIYCKTNTEIKYCTFMTPDLQTFTMSNDPMLRYQGGRLRYPVTSQPDQTCGINITRVASQDFGQWRCQVVGLIAGKMSTATADITLREDTGVRMQLITSENGRTRSAKLELTTRRAVTTRPTEATSTRIQKTFRGANAEVPEVKPGHHSIKEYHIHVYFLQHNQEQVNAALEIRDAVVEEVRAGNLTVVCNGVTSQILPGINDDEVYDFNMEPIGPHPIGSFEIWVPQEHLPQALSFVLLRRGSLSLLLHPLGRTEIEDHTIHATFFGKQYGLDLSPLSNTGGDDPQYVGLGLGYSKQ